MYGVDQRRARAEMLPLSHLDASLIENAMRHVVEFTVGFVKPGETHDAPPELLGSGTLVTLAGKRAILTAAHVLTLIRRVVAPDGRLGLLLLPGHPQQSIPLESCAVMPVAKGINDEAGPDLGAIILPETVAGAIAAKKTFFNLDVDRDQLLENPPDRHLGFWFACGFPAVSAIRVTDEDGEVIRFLNFYGAGGPDEAVTRGDYDYYKFPVSQACRADAPSSFAGMSGGGLWQIRIRRTDEGLTTLRPLLSGVVYYQVNTPRELALMCHGMRSVYDIAYRSVATGSPPRS